MLTSPPDLVGKYDHGRIKSYFEITNSNINLVFRHT